MLQQIHALYEDGVLKPLEPLRLSEHQRVCVSVTADEATAPSKIDEESFYEAASRLGYLLTAALPMGRRAPNGSPDSSGKRWHHGSFAAHQSIGCIKGTKPDLSTNKNYMEGFGKRGV